MITALATRILILTNYCKMHKSTKKISLFHLVTECNGYVYTRLLSPVDSTYEKYMRIKKKVGPGYKTFTKLEVGDHSRPEGSLFDSLLHQGVGEGATPFPGLLHFTLDPYLIMLSVKQGGIKYHFLSLWYDSTWDWTQVSRAIGEHSNR